MNSESSRPKAQSRKIGGIRIHMLEAGLQRLDGGAMFGVVPRTLWERRIAPDALHRIPLALRCMLVEAPEALVLVDTGLGNKESARFQEMYGVENQGEPTALEDAIRTAGFHPEDVDLVVNTHLHFDHAGGNTVLQPGGEVVPSFPRAHYVVDGAELAFAAIANERTRASYLPHNLEPITQAGLWREVGNTEEVEVTRGVRMLATPGHTPHHRSVLVGDGGEKALFLADLCPTVAHLPLPWIMGYDLEPLITLESKRRAWERARDEDWLLLFQHDPELPWGRLDPHQERPALAL